MSTPETPRKVVWKHFPTDPAHSYPSMEGLIGRKTFAFVVFSSPIKCTVGPEDNQIELHTNNAAQVKEICLALYDVITSGAGT